MSARDKPLDVVRANCKTGAHTIKESAQTVPGGALVMQPYDRLRRLREPR